VPVFEQSGANPRVVVPGNRGLAITIGRKTIHDYLVATIGEPVGTAVQKFH